MGEMGELAKPNSLSWFGNFELILVTRVSGVYLFSKRRIPLCIVLYFTELPIKLYHLNKGRMGILLGLLNISLLVNRFSFYIFQLPLFRCACNWNLPLSWVFSNSHSYGVTFAQTNISVWDLAFGKPCLNLTLIYYMWVRPILDKPYLITFCSENCSFFQVFPFFGPKLWDPKSCNLDFYVSPQLIQITPLVFSSEKGLGKIFLEFGTKETWETQVFLIAEKTNCIIYNLHLMQSLKFKLVDILSILGFTVTNPCQILFSLLKTEVISCLAEYNRNYSFPIAYYACYITILLTLDLFMFVISLYIFSYASKVWYVIPKKVTRMVRVMAHDKLRRKSLLYTYGVHPLLFLDSPPLCALLPICLVFPNHSHISSALQSSHASDISQVCSSLSSFFSLLFKHWEPIGANRNHKIEVIHSWHSKRKR
ncbi:hypothetical protein VP01_4525g1 [Puccinia sorghi]|uniref:Uncharacterized protein n=1 Tax=Puccinia sorghi TaxID=27349 RepID=A0A0L6UNY3_9BASI|nr:hypothetical protein VP01_4525g1 [Puccinia sorghi]